MWGPFTTIGLISTAHKLPTSMTKTWTCKLSNSTNSINHNLYRRYWVNNINKLWQATHTTLLTPEMQLLLLSSTVLLTVSPNRTTTLRHSRLDRWTRQTQLIPRRMATRAQWMKASLACKGWHHRAIWTQRIVGSLRLRIHSSGLSSRASCKDRCMMKHSWWSSDKFKPLSNSESTPLTTALWLSSRHLERLEPRQCCPFPNQSRTLSSTRLSKSLLRMTLSIQSFSSSAKPYRIIPTSFRRNFVKQYRCT